MEATMYTLTITLLVGVVATSVIDLWSLARARFFGIARPDYGHLGRWIAHMRDGRFRHDSIAGATPRRHERAIGWAAHYGIGCAFAMLLPLLWGEQWLREPTLGPALIVGVATVAAPFLLMQPGMGAGLAARRTPKPAMVRLHSLSTHTIFGLALFGAARAISSLPLPS
jgi:hypothetical protein